MLWLYSFFILWIAHGLCLKLSAPLTAIVNQAVNVTWTKDSQQDPSDLTFCWGQTPTSGKVENCTDVQDTAALASGSINVAFHNTGQYFVAAFKSSGGGNSRRGQDQGHNSSGGGKGGKNGNGDGSEDDLSSPQPLTFLAINVESSSSASTVGPTTTSASMSETSSQKPDPATAPLIVGIVLTATVLVALLLTFFILRYRRKRRFHRQIPSDIRGSIEKPLWLENMYMNHPESNGLKSVRPVTISTAPDLDYTESESHSSDRNTLTFFPYMMVRNTAQPSALGNPISVDRTVDISISEPSESGRTNGSDKKSETETIVSRSTDTPSILPPGFSYPTIVTTPATPEPVLVYTPRTRTT